MSALTDGLVEIQLAADGAVLLEGAKLIVNATGTMIDKHGRLLWTGPVDFKPTPLSHDRFPTAIELEE